MSSSIPFTRHVLITGSSRGIGLEFVTQYLKQPNTHVIATARNLSKAKALHELKQKYPNSLTLIEMDVSSSESVDSALQSLPPLSIVINNAGIAPSFNGSNTTVDDLSTTFNTNVIGTLLTIQRTLPALQQAIKHYHIRPVVVNLSSTAGSIKETVDQVFNGGKGLLSYRISKAAVNMLTASVAQEHPDITFIAVHPGWVDTSMGRSGGPIPPTKPYDSVNSMRTLIDTVKPQQSGHFLRYDGAEISW